MPPKRFYLLTAPSWYPGLFSCYQAVVGFLNWYEDQNAAGLSLGMKVCFEQGLYFDSGVGPNWWEYYFEPILTGDPPAQDVEVIPDGVKAAWATEAISKISRRRAGDLIRRYIRVKPHIQRKIDAFVRHEFRGRYVVAVHYRGTDKACEAPPRAVRNVVVEAVSAAMAGHHDCLIFVATDEQRCLDYIRGTFGDRVVCMDTRRSTTDAPVHHVNGGCVPMNRYELGEEAVVDCMLLSKSNIMVRTHSNLSSSAANINPTLPVINVNHAHYFPGLR